MLSHIQNHRVTRFYAVPPIMLALAQHPLVDEYDLSSLRSTHDQLPDLIDAE